MRSHLIIISALVFVSSFYHATVEAIPSEGVCADRDMTDSLSGPRQHVFRTPSRRRDGDETVLDVLRKDRRFSRLVQVIGRAGGNLRNDLEGNGRERTVLAPTNDAFRALEDSLGMRIEELGHHDLGKLVRYHIVPKRAYPRKELVNGELLETAVDDHKPLGGERAQVIRVSKVGPRVHLNLYAQVIEADIQASNGIIHAVSDVLYLPRPLFETLTLVPAEFSTHALALQLTGLANRVDRTAKVTALVATNEAWGALGHVELLELFAPENREELKRVLLKHYIPEVAYIRELAEENGLSEEACARGKLEENDRDNNDDRRVVKRNLNTWADERVTVRIACRGGQLRAVVDETTIALQDLPADNGVVHVVAAPLVLNHQRRNRDLLDNSDEPNDEGNNDDVADEGSQGRRQHRRHRRHHDNDNLYW